MSCNDDQKKDTRQIALRQIDIGFLLSSVYFASFLCTIVMANLSAGTVRHCSESSSDRCKKDQPF
jgi:hypothetical protein